jgi:hypothetical protein
MESYDVEDRHSRSLGGAIKGAGAGFLYGGPVGAIVGGIVGGFSSDDNNGVSVESDSNFPSTLGHGPAVDPNSVVQPSTAFGFGGGTGKLPQSQQHETLLGTIEEGVTTLYDDAKGGIVTVYDDAKSGVNDIYDLGLYFEWGLIGIGLLLAYGISQSFAQSDVSNVGEGVSKVVKSAGTIAPLAV